MIHDLAMAVKALLRVKRFPYPVEYGPERCDREGFNPAIVFFRASRVPGGAGDAIAPPPNTKLNPRSPYVRRVAGGVDVFARSPKAGAAVWDHEDECDAVCNGVLCAMYRVLQGKGLPLEISGSRLLTAEDFNGLRTWPGAAARITFAVTTLVLDVDYKGEGPPTGEVHAVAAPTVQAAIYPEPEEP